MNNQSVLEKYPFLMLFIPLYSYCQTNAGLGWRGESKNVSRATVIRQRFPSAPFSTE